MSECLTYFFKCADFFANVHFSSFKVDLYSVAGAYLLEIRQREKKTLNSRKNGLYGKNVFILQGIPSVDLFVDSWHFWNHYRQWTRFAAGFAETCCFHTGRDDLVRFNSIQA